MGKSIWHDLNTHMQVWFKKDHDIKYLKNNYLQSNILKKKFSSMLDKMKILNVHNVARLAIIPIVYAANSNT